MRWPCRHDHAPGGPFAPVESLARTLAARRRFVPMAMARFKDLCLDAGDPAALGAFWAAVLHRTWQAQDNGDGLLTGPTPQHTIWVNQVPEPKAVKYRVHL